MSDKAMQDRAPIATERTLEGLHTGLFIQAPQARHDFVRRLITDEGLGVVYSMSHQRRKRRPVAEMRAIVDYTRRGAPGADILVDANRYSGRNRKMASDGLSQEWLRDQLKDGGLPYALTDSGYIGRGDTAGLETVLRQSGNFQGRVVTALPLAWQWLTEDLDHLMDRVEAHGRPIALAVEHESDPMSEKGTAEGLSRILAGGVPALMLRSDMSALGALAYGAAGVAVGTDSGLRHIYPITRKRGGAAPPPSALVPGLLGYYHLEKIGDAVQQNPDLNVWSCGCSHCAGRRLDWFRFNTKPSDDAFAHSLAALAALGRRIAGTEESARAALWTSMCQDAQIRHFDIRIGDDGQTWEPKKALGNWVAATPTRVGEE